MLDLVEVMDKIDLVTKTYEDRRVEEILASQLKSGRISPDQLAGLVGKANACRELRNSLYVAFGIST